MGSGVLGSEVPPLALKATDFAKASTGQDGGQAGYQEKRLVPLVRLVQLVRFNKYNELIQ